MEKIEGSFIYVKVPTGLLNKVDCAAKRTNNTRAEMVRNFLELGTDIFRIYEGVGIIKVAEIIFRTKKITSRTVGQQELFND